MGRSSSLSVLLIAAVLLLSFSHGLGRKLMQTYENEEDSAVLMEENVGSARVLSGDYDDGPQANTNPSGYNFPQNSGATTYNPTP